MTSGYCYGEPEPKERCPYCGAMCCADFVDIGVGMTQCGPYHCEACGASQIGPYDENETTPEEDKIGWYGPDRPPGSSANVVAGQHVTWQEARDVYRAMWPISASPAGQKSIRGE